VNHVSRFFSYTTSDRLFSIIPNSMRRRFLCPRKGILSRFENPCYLDISRQFTDRLFRSSKPGSARGRGGGPRLFAEVVPTPHTDNCQWPVKTKRANARSCASVVIRKRPLLNRASFEVA